MKAHLNKEDGMCAYVYNSSYAGVGRTIASEAKLDNYIRHCCGHLGYFPVIYYVWYSPCFPNSESTSSFLLALQSCKPPASSAVFPVTVTTFCRGLGDKLYKYLIQILIQIRAQGFEKFSPLSLLA
jgi:hypothetical protein